MEEIWKDIPNYSHYQVSNLGRVKTLSYSYINAIGHLVHVKERVLKQSESIYYRNGKIDYNRIKIIDDNGISHYFYVHRLVAEAFIENPLNLPEVNHIDLNKSNNQVSNLEWVSKEQNAKRCIQSPHLGGTNGNSKLTEEIVRWAIEQGEMGVSYAEISRQIALKWGISISSNQISNIINKKQWKHIK